MPTQYITDTDYTPTEEEELAWINNGKVDKDKYNKDPVYRAQMRNALHAQSAVNASKSAATGDKLQNSRVAQEGSDVATGVAPDLKANATAHDAVTQEVLRGGVEQNKAGNPVNTGVGSKEGGDKPLGERMEDLRDPTPSDAQKPASLNTQQSMVDKAVSGDLDSKDRDYLVANAIATFARNLGTDIGNVAAAYSGGSINNNRDKSLLEQRMEQRAQAGTETEIKHDYSESRLGQELTHDQLVNESARISNMNQADQRKWAQNLASTLYDENGDLRVDPQSAEFRNVLTMANQLMSGGGVRDSVLSAFMNKVMMTAGDLGLF